MSLFPAGSISIWQEPPTDADKPQLSFNYSATWWQAAFRDYGFISAFSPSAFRRCSTRSGCILGPLACSLGTLGLHLLVNSYCRLFSRTSYAAFCDLLDCILGYQGCILGLYLWTGFWHLGSWIWDWFLFVYISIHVYRRYLR